MQSSCVGVGGGRLVGWLLLGVPPVVLSALSILFSYLPMQHPVYFLPSFTSTCFFPSYFRVLSRVFVILNELDVRDGRCVVCSRLIVASHVEFLSFLSAK